MMFEPTPAAALEAIQDESEKLRSKLERDISSLEESLSHRERGFSSYLMFYLFLR